MLNLIRLPSTRLIWRKHLTEYSIPYCIKYYIMYEWAKIYKTVCSNGTTKIIINWKPTSWIFVDSSVKQGCPLSPLLFSIYLEPFCRTIINNTSVNGVSLQNIEVKLQSDADGVVIFCKDKGNITAAV